MPDVESRTLGLVEAARARWPGVDLDDESFLSQLGKTLSTSEDPCAELAALHGEDFYLALACLAGDKAALGILERDFIMQVKYVPAFGQGHAFADEIKQRVREALLFGTGGGPPKLASYSGRGALSSWLRVVIARTAINDQRGRKEWPRDEDAELQTATPDPELTYMKAQYAAEFKASFHATLRALPVRQRMILRLYFLDGMTSNGIAALYDVHPITVTKWLARIREQILAVTRQSLRERLGVDSGELDSLMGLIMSRLDASISTILRQRR
jgi:RNA polymerase sigma-70 factor (ECF subfamily)